MLIPFNRNYIIEFIVRSFDANSVVTCRHITNNTSASEPRSAKKVAVKKVSDVDVSIFGPEL